MKMNKKKKTDIKSTAPSDLRIQVTNELLRHVEKIEDLGPNQPKTLMLYFVKGQLGDAQNNQSFRGEIWINIKVPVSAEACQILGRIMQPYTGIFTLAVNGTYQILNSGTSISVDTDVVQLISLVQPAARAKPTRRHKNK